MNDQKPETRRLFFWQRGFILFFPKKKQKKIHFLAFDFVSDFYGASSSVDTYWNIRGKLAPVWQVQIPNGGPTDRQTQAA